MDFMPEKPLHRRARGHSCSPATRFSSGASAAASHAWHQVPWPAASPPPDRPARPNWPSGVTAPATL